MVCLGLEPGAAGWKAQMNPLSYVGTHWKIFLGFPRGLWSAFLMAYLIGCDLFTFVQLIVASAEAITGKKIYLLIIIRYTDWLSCFFLWMKTLPIGKVDPILSYFKQYSVTVEFMKFLKCLRHPELAKKGPGMAH